jgi:hypothetical protein
MGIISLGLRWIPGRDHVSCIALIGRDHIIRIAMDSRQGSYQ